MKKLICIICTLFILCGQVFANEYIPADVVDTEYENAYEVLTGLSIFDYNDDSSFRPLTPITRGDFAIALGNIMKFTASDGCMYFVDVPEEHNAFDAVNKLTRYGVINGVGNGEFHPDENIKAVDAVRILTAMMGYAAPAEQQGGYPDGYMKIARSVGLLDGVRIESNGELLRGEAVQMLLNALEVPVVSVNFADSYSLSVDNDKEFLYAAMGIKKIKGIVKANNFYSVDDGLIAPMNSLRIDDTIYYDMNNQWSDMVGYHVTCYFYEDDHGDNIAVYLHKNASKTKDIMVLARDVNDFKFPYFRYYKNSKLKKLVVSDDLYMIYNGIRKDSIVAADFHPDSGELKFIDSDNDGKYDIVEIKSYRNALVSNVTEEAIYISCPVNDKLEIADYETVNIYNMEGNMISLLELKENDVISIYENIDKSLINIVYSREQMTGTVSDVYEEDGLISLLIDDVLYNLAFDYDKSFPFMLSMGTSGVFCLDANGDIYTMVGEKTTTRRYGYVIKSWEDVDECTFMLRILEENGKIVDRALSKKVRVDGESSIKSDIAIGLIASAVPGPIVYKTSRIGEINMIDTVLQRIGNDDDSLRLVNTGLSGMYRTRTMCFNFALPIDVDTKFFIIPKDPQSTDRNEFGFADYKILQNEVTYSNMDSYSLGDKLTADIVVMRGNSSLNTIIGIVTGTKKMLNSDNEIVTSYTVQSGSGELSYPVTEESVSTEIHKITSGSGNDTTALADPGKTLRVDVGDLVKLYTNNAGEIEKISMIYDVDAELVYSANPNVADANVTSFDRYIFGEIAEIDKNIVAIARSSTSYEYYNLKDKAIYIYTEANRKADRMRAGRLGDLKEGDSILIVSRGGIPQYAFAY